MPSDGRVRGRISGGTPAALSRTHRPAGWIALAALLSSCAVTQVPLQPEHGYPTAWPRLLPLSESFIELNGVYANQGFATAADGEFVPIKLADLVPRMTPRKQAAAEPDSGCEDCVAVRVLAKEGTFLSWNGLRFTVPDGSERRVFDVDSAGKTNAALYPLTGSGGSAIVGMTVSNTEVRLTCAEDGSLIAQIHSTSGLLLLMLIPITNQNDYVWARFERIGELGRPLATNTAPPADQ